MNVTRTELKEDIVKVSTVMEHEMNEIRGVLKEIQKSLGKQRVIDVGENSNQQSLRSILGAGPGGVGQRPPVFVDDHGVLYGAAGGARHEEGVIDGYKKHLKLGFTKFRGQDYRGWIRKCFKFFKFRVVPEFERIELASMHIEGVAEFWYQNYVTELEGLSWEEFTHRIALRFGLQQYENEEGEFARLRQITTVNEYQDKFEELMALMKAENPGLTEKYFVNCFVGGLKEEIQYRVQSQFPQTLLQTVSTA